MPDAYTTSILLMTDQELLELIEQEAKRIDHFGFLQSEGPTRIGINCEVIRQIAQSHAASPKDVQDLLSTLARSKVNDAIMERARVLSKQFPRPDFDPEKLSPGDQLLVQFMVEEILEGNGYNLNQLYHFAEKLIDMHS